MICPVSLPVFDISILFIFVIRINERAFNGGFVHQAIDGDLLICITVPKHSRWNWIFAGRRG